ncbi:MAG: hypothetical protein M1816_004361 [Peltula sp. TS41687]|nr:MAG: hypothetical protein M1816_004361 [Peltula sp. TS41687]
MFSGILKSVKNIFSSSEYYDSDQRLDRPQPAIAQDISTCEPHQIGDIMVQTRRSSQVAGEPRPTSMPDEVAIRKRPRVATHVEITIPNKRRRGEDVTAYVDVKVDEDSGRPEEQSTGVLGGVKDDDNVASQSVKEQKDAVVGKVGDRQTEAIGAINPSGVVDVESSKPVSASKTPKRSRRSRGQRKKVDSVVAEGPIGKGKRQHSAPDTQTVRDKAEEKSSSGVTGGSPGKPQTKSRHIKFGDDEPVGPSPIEATSESQRPSEHVEQTEDEDEDENEAPEAESLSVAQSKAKARTRHVARAIERQEADARDKRRKRDKRLKEQASLQKAKRQRPTDVASPNPIALAEIDEKDFDLRARSILDNKPLGLLKASELPDLLPDEILAAKPYAEPGQPDKLGSQKHTTKKHIIFQAEEKRPKDIQRGGVKVRVLTANNPKLPPKSNTGVKAVRENWLAGRMGKGGLIERRSMSSSFLRR